MMYKIAEATMSDIKNKSIEKRSHYLKSKESWFPAETEMEYLNMFTLKNILIGETDCVNIHIRAIPVLVTRATLTIFVCICPPFAHMLYI